jgi:hypothetical protein
MKKIRKIEKTQNYNFQKLTPTNNADLTIYEDVLDFIFKNDDIKNVAISGPYSSGKSSIIETYKYRHKEKKMLHISLAHFTEIQEKDSLENSKINETILEGKILNQLLHQIDVRNIPQTKFRVKQKIPWYKILKNTLLLTLSILFSVYLFSFDKWNKYVGLLPDGLLKTIVSVSVNYNVRILVGLLLSVFTVSIIYSAMKAQMNKNIIKK